VLRKLLSATVAGAIILSGAAAMAPATVFAAVETPAHLKPHVIGGNVRILVSGDDFIIYQKGQSKDLVRHDLRTGKEQVILTGVEPNFMSLAGRYLTLAHGMPGQASLILRNLETNQSSTLVSNSTVIDPHVAGGLVAWVRTPRNSSFRSIMLYEIATGEQREAARSPMEVSIGRLGFDGRYLFWTESDYRMEAGSERTRLIAMDLQTGKRTERTTALRVELGGVAGGRVLYAAYPETWDHRDEVRVWDLKTGEDRQLAVRQHTYWEWMPSFMPHIQGEQAVWTDSEALFVSDLAGGSLRRILTAEAGHRHMPKLAGSYVVYNLRGGGWPLHAVPITEAAREAQPPQQIYREVKAGDLLWRVAHSHGVALPDLIRANNMLNPNSIYPGQKLFLPHPVSAPHEPYVVRSGDSLASLAARFVTSSTHIVQRNEGARYGVHVGQTLLMPRGPEKICSKTENRCFQTYAVMPGDSLWRISRASGTSIQFLLQRNEIRDASTLYVGQTLIIRE